MNYKQLSEDISNWIKDYAVSNQIDSLVVGVSGGIDSAVVSTLCVRTGFPVKAYGLPIDSHDNNNLNSTIQLGFLRNNYLNVETKIEDLSHVYRPFNLMILSPLARANTKARLRMTYLYAQATTLNGLVIGTGNKIEDFGVGFFTKYGDGGIDISPIADLTKTEVYGLAKYLGIPQEIIDAPPTDGLWDDPNHNDEAQIGATYPELEWAMEFYELHEEYPENIILSQRQREVLSIYLKFNTKNKHKMLTIPVFKVNKEKYQ